MASKKTWRRRARFYRRRHAALQAANDRLREKQAGPGALGTMLIAGMRAKITKVEFSEGQMWVTAELPNEAAGPVGGQWQVLGSDGTTCFVSRSAPPPGHFGVKLAGDWTWELRFGACLEPAEGWPDEAQARARWDAGQYPFPAHPPGAGDDT